jgi:hypothetical protein
MIGIGFTVVQVVLAGVVLVDVVRLVRRLSREHAA